MFELLLNLCIFMVTCHLEWLTECKWQSKTEADLEILDPGQEAGDEFVEDDDLDSAETKLDAVVDQIHVSTVLLDQLGEDLEENGESTTKT